MQPRPIVRWLARRRPEILYFADTSRKIVALTIDDGPHQIATPAILDVLREHDARATFFLIGGRVHGNESLVRRIVEEGHELGNHLMTAWPSILHTRRQFRSQLERAAETLERFGEVRWFRPGSGWFSKGMLEETGRRGYSVALGSVYPHDPWVTSAGLNARYILRRIFAGGIIILHDGKAGRIRTAAILRIVLPVLRERGYRVVGLSEMVAVVEVEREKATRQERSGR